MEDNYLLTIRKALKDLEKNLELIQNKFTRFSQVLNEKKDDTTNYYVARAVYSYINSVAETRICNCNMQISCLVETIDFIGTFDDKYLSSLKSMLETQFKTDITYIKDVKKENEDLLNFLESVVNKLQLYHKKGGNGNEKLS